MKNITSQTTDEELMSLYLQADTHAFEELYSRHSGKLLGYLRKKVPAETAEELLQDVFARMHSSRATYNENYLFLPWIFTIARNAILDFYKKAETRVSLASQPVNDDVLAATPTAESATELDVSAYLLALSPRQKKIFELRYLRDWSFEQIAKETALSPSNVRQIISRGLKQLKTEGSES